MSVEKEKVWDDQPQRCYSFPITLQVQVGEVKFDMDSDADPLVIAMSLIGDDMNGRDTGSSGEFVYHFSIPAFHDGDMPYPYRVTVEQLER